MHHAPEQSDRVREIYEEVTQGAVFGGNGPDCSLAGTDTGAGALLSQPQEARPPPQGTERMLHIYFMQYWFSLSDPDMEEALYDSREMREFAGIDLGEEPAPDESAILKFRHLLESKDMGAELLRLVNGYLGENGLKISLGSIVDASIFNAPSSTKNREQACDPDMHQTKMGNFGMKLHIGVDSKTRLVHSAVATAPMYMTRRCWMICCKGRRRECG